MWSSGIMGEIKMEDKKYDISIEFTETDNGYVYMARFPMLNGVCGSGMTPILAIQDLYFNASAHIEAFKEHLSDNTLSHNFKLKYYEDLNNVLGIYNYVVMPTSVSESASRLRDMFKRIIVF